MFRKKPNIPPRPLPPTADQIEDDLQKVPVDDVVFRLFEEVKVQENINNEAISEDISESSIQSVNADTVYTQVKRLVEVNKDLKELLVVLTEKNYALQTSRNGLKYMADEIRQQSMEALK